MIILIKYNLVNVVKIVENDQIISFLFCFAKDQIINLKGQLKSK